MRVKLSFLFLFAALALSGCGQTESTTTESDYISVGDYDLSQPNALPQEIEQLILTIRSKYAYLYQ